MYVCMYECMYVRMYACMHVCTYLCMCILLHIRMYVCIYVGRLVCEHVTMYVGKQVCPWVRMHVLVHMNVFDCLCILVGMHAARMWAGTFLAHMLACTHACVCVTMYARRCVSLSLSVCFANYISAYKHPCRCIKKCTCTHTYVNRLHLCLHTWTSCEPSSGKTGHDHQL